MIHRKGQFHKNADGLSRWQCKLNSCSYCARIERKNLEGKNETVTRIVLVGEILEDWRKEQLEDPGISVIYRGKETGIRPRAEVAREPFVQIYWAYWNALSHRDGVLYKKWKSPSLKTGVYQLIVPWKYVKRILEEAHDSPSGFWCQ